ncbi:MAG: hypothetical protein HYY52_01570 [Candidatus Melainabacteria bacterium]|nr:hypothetical protein [Candidatus Melainabacteria bacterium]
MFVFAFVFSNLLSLVGPSAQAAITTTAPTAGTCFQHSGTTSTGALVTVYNIGTIQITLTAAELSPAQDAAPSGSANGATANATTGGDISAASNVTGNVFSFVPPTGTNFVVVPGFQDTTAGNSNEILPANATISNALSSDNTTGTPDSNLAISVGVVTTGTAGIGRAIVAIARDGDTTGGAGVETYPKTNTGSNTATISITGLGIAVPPSGDVSLSGTLTATIEANPPSGIGAIATTTTAGGAGTTTAAAAIPGISGTINLCTITSPAGQLEAVLDADDDSTDLYDKHAASANLVALGQVGANTTVNVFDTTTSAAGASLDLEPILIRGTAGTGSSTKDQVFATGELLSDIDSAAEVPSGSALDLTATFGNSVAAPITVTFSDDNAAATTTLSAVDIILSSSTPGAAPSAAGHAAGQTSRHGYLGALRAALFDSATSSVSTAAFAAGGTWGIASVTGGPGLAVQESRIAGTTDTNGANLLTGSFGNGNVPGTLAAEPYNPAFVDLHLYCGTSTNPVAGWFAIVSSAVNAAGTAVDFGTTTSSQQRLAASQAGTRFLVSSATNFFTQSLTNIFGTTPGATTTNPTFLAGGILGTTMVADSQTLDNAILYASCTNNTLTILPIQNGFDATRDIIAITPRLAVTNVSNTFSSDVNLIAQVSGNNLIGTTTLNLAKLVGVPATGQTSILASAQGVAVSESSQLGISCSSGGQSSVVLSAITSGTVDTAVMSACSGGTIAPAPAFFTGGASSSVSGTTVIAGSPTVQGESRGILVSELNATGFSELLNQVGGGSQGTVFEVQLPSGCDVIDDRDDNNTASSSSATAGSLGGNDVARYTITQTGGVTATFAASGTGDAAITNANVVVPAAGTTPAKLHFGIVSALGTGTDAVTTDAVLIRIDAQDLFCPIAVTGNLEASVIAQNKVNSPSIVANLGKAMLGAATQALGFAFADDVATSTKGETSTNAMIGATPRLSTGGVTTSHPVKITELDARAIPIGGRVSPRNLDPENSLLSTVLSRGQIWLIPAAGTAFSAAPATADVSFSDDSLVIDGTPTLVTSATVDPNPPIGTVVIGVKKNTASGAANPMESTTTITVKNLKFTAASSTTTDLIASAVFFVQDAGIVVNTPGAASGNNASTPTVFTPYVQASAKALTQLEAAGVQLGTGSLANQLLTSRLTAQSTPQINPFAKVVTSAMNADASKITVSSLAATASSSGAATTDIVVTVTGTAGAVDGGAEVVVTTGGTTTYDSVTVVASEDGSFTAKLRGDCAASATSVSVSVAESVSGTKTTSVTKTALCAGGGGGQTADDVFNAIAGSDGSVTLSELTTYITAQGGLGAIITSGGSKLQGVIKAAKSALGLS